MLPPPPEVPRKWATAFLGFSITSIEHPSWLVIGERLEECPGQHGAGDKTRRDNRQPEVCFVDPEPPARLLGEAEEAITAGGEAAADTGDVAETRPLAGLSVESAPSPLSHELDLLTDQDRARSFNRREDLLAGRKLPRQADDPRRAAGTRLFADEGDRGAGHRSVEEQVPFIEQDDRFNERLLQDETLDALAIADVEPIGRRDEGDASAGTGDLQGAYEEEHVQSRQAIETLTQARFEAGMYGFLLLGWYRVVTGVGRVASDRIRTLGQRPIEEIAAPELEPDPFVGITQLDVQPRHR